MAYTSILSHALRIIIATSKYHIASMDAELSAVFVVTYSDTTLFIVLDTSKMFVDSCDIFIHILYPFCAKLSDEPKHISTFMSLLNTDMTKVV